MVEVVEITDDDDEVLKLKDEVGKELAEVVLVLVVAVVAMDVTTDEARVEVTKDVG
jgi:hypothetical protein